MNRISRTFVVSILVAATALYAQDPPRKCSQVAKECEQQIRQMLSGRRYLGLQLVELKPGLVVKSVLKDGPAYKAGFLDGDRLIAINGHQTTESTIRDFKQILAEARGTGMLWIIVQRRGAYKKIEVRLEPYSKDQIDKIIAGHVAQFHTATAGHP